MNKDLKQGLAIGIVFAAAVAAMSPIGAEASERCLSSASVERIDIEDRQTLRFEMRNGDVYLNKLNGSLMGSTFDTLTIERRPSTTQYCRMDRVGTIDPITRPNFPLPGRFGNIPYSASLGDFELVERSSWEKTGYLLGMKY